MYFSRQTKFLKKQVNDNFNTQFLKSIFLKGLEPLQIL